MSEFVVLDAEGRFLAGFALGSAYWSLEFPDARVFDVKANALKAARITRELCEVVEDYGLDTQRTIETVG